MEYELKTEAEVRAAFWRENPGASRKRIPTMGNMYVTDTRCRFAEWLDNAARSERLSSELSNNVTLG